MNNEIEAKFLSTDKEAIRLLLVKNDFRLVAPEYLMKRKTFDLPNAGDIKNKWVRVRQEADKITLAVKEIRGKGITDVYETEIVINDFDKAVTLLEACGLKLKAYQETKRELWKQDNIEITIDTWPGLDPFVEIEGDSVALVKAVAEKLGLDFNHALFGSVDVVYEKLLGIAPDIINALPEITFENPPTNAQIS